MRIHVTNWILPDVEDGHAGLNASPPGRLIGSHITEHRGTRWLTLVSVEEEAPEGPQEPAAASEGQESAVAAPSPIEVRQHAQGVPISEALFMVTWRSGTQPVYHYCYFTERGAALDFIFESDDEDTAVDVHLWSRNKKVDSKWRCVL